MTQPSAAEFTHAAEARRLLRACRSASLATVSKRLGGYPFATVVPFMTDHDGSVVLLISRLAEHTKNIDADERASVMVHSPVADVQAAARLTIAGNCRRIEDSTRAAHRYLRVFPAAADLVRLDFQFYRLQPVAIRYIGGFGSIHWLSPQAFAGNAASLAASEDAWLKRINDGVCLDLHACLRRLHPSMTATPIAIAFDCDGLDVRAGAETIRISFAAPVADTDGLNAALERLKNQCSGSA